MGLHRLGDVFSRIERHTGFIGDGFPAKHTDAEGIPMARRPEATTPYVHELLLGTEGDVGLRGSCYHQLRAVRRRDDDAR